MCCYCFVTRLLQIPLKQHVGASISAAQITTHLSCSRSKLLSVIIFLSYHPTWSLLVTLLTLILMEIIKTSPVNVCKPLPPLDFFVPVIVRHHCCRWHPWLELHLSVCSQLCLVNLVNVNAANPILIVGLRRPGFNTGSDSCHFSGNAAWRADNCFFPS